MDLDDLIITWFCLIDLGLQVALDSKRLRASGPRPTLSDGRLFVQTQERAYRSDGVMRFLRTLLRKIWGSSGRHR